MSALGYDLLVVSVCVFWVAGNSAPTGYSYRFGNVLISIPGTTTRVVWWNCIVLNSWTWMLMRLRLKTGSYGSNCGAISSETRSKRIKRLFSNVNHWNLKEIIVQTGFNICLSSSHLGTVFLIPQPDILLFIFKRLSSVRPVIHTGILGATYWEKVRTRDQTG